MRDRTIKAQAEARQHLDGYIRQTAGSSPVDELANLSDLKDKRSITAEEYERMKAKLLA